MRTTIWMSAASLRERTHVLRIERLEEIADMGRVEHINDMLMINLTYIISRDVDSCLSSCI